MAKERVGRMIGKCESCGISCEQYKCQACSWEDAYSGAIKELESVIKVLLKKERADYSQSEDTANIATRFMKNYDLMVATLTTIADKGCEVLILGGECGNCENCLARITLREI